MSRIKRIMLGVGVVAACGTAAVTWNQVEDHPFTPLLEPGPARSRTEFQASPDTPPAPTDLPHPVMVKSRPVLSTSPPPPPSEKRIRSLESPSVQQPQPQPEQGTETVHTPGPRQHEPLVEVVQPVRRPGRALQDPLARIALAYVGVDVDAEEYWIDAIFDSSLSDEERDDLMEDLNEVGFSNGEYPGPGDLPLIVNRIAIVEELLPVADAFMQKHLDEAHKDLENMLYGKLPE